MWLDRVIIWFHLLTRKNLQVYSWTYKAWKPRCPELHPTYFTWYIYLYYLSLFNNIFQVNVIFLCPLKTRNTDPAGNCMFKVSNRNTRTSCEIFSKLTIKTPERCHWRRSGVFIVNFENISHLSVVFL